MIRTIAKLAVIGVSLLGASAHAALLEYGFADGMGNREASGPLTYSSNGVDVTILGSRGGVEQAIHINGDTGLGVAGNADAEGNRIGVGEGLVLSFSPAPVTLLRVITFDTIDNNEPVAFALFVDGVIAGTFNITPDLELFQSVDVSGFGTRGSVFTIQGLAGSEGFRVAGIRAQVPEPGLLALFGLGLLAMGAARRRAA
ncbi:MAG: PEP-CTERM sorting domain-containing protein [Pseudomonadota bacterium]